MTSEINNVNYSKSIQLPDSVEVFRNLKNAKRFAIDIGGTLTKIAYYSTVPYRKVSYKNDGLNKGHAPGEANNTEEKGKLNYEVSVGERLHFVKFETKHIETCLNFIRQNLVGSVDAMKGKSIIATGGGAYKYADLIQNKLGLAVDKEDEMKCLIEGCNFLLKNVPNEVFEYQRHADPEYRFQSIEPNIFPYLLVNIGSGVSIMKVESEDKYERIGGTATGGGTFWGLGSLLTTAKNFHELLSLAEQGDHRPVDMLVKDIYGGDYHALGLSADLIASSFGKAAQLQPQDRQKHEADFARSLLLTISNDIGQIACLYAMMHGLKKVYFGGYFLRNHPLTMHTISFAIRYWSKGGVAALFLRHEGYLGAIGAFLKGAEEGDPDKYSWSENYAGSTGLEHPVLPGGGSGVEPVTVDQLEMDRFCQVLVYCPLLYVPSQYVPDTVDLTQDVEARHYWLRCFEDSLDTFVAQAVKSQPSAVDAPSRADKFKDKYLGRLRHLSQHPCAFGPLTVRSLLDLREQCLKEADFPDPYLQQKQAENSAALLCLATHLERLDALSVLERQEAVLRGILAGNVFDWGAQEAASLMSDPAFGFEQAASRIQVRPWLVDHVEAWLSRLAIGEPYKCAAIFIDNSGLDIVLGVLPFARELVRLGTKVLLCANAEPALNDVTASELEVLLQQTDLEEAWSGFAQVRQEGRVLVVNSGQASPCLDLGRISSCLAEALTEHQVDLIVLEGMGRAIHTNLNAQFTCDALKVAVIKNRWLARRLGGAEGDTCFPVVCRFEPATKTHLPSV